MNWPGPRDSYAAQRNDIDAAIARVLESGWYILGDEVSAFEREFAQFVGSVDAIGVGNGTDGLVVALRACGVRPGDSVATVSHTAVATVAAIEMAGARPLLVDIDETTMTMDPASLRRTLDAAGGAQAIVPVHLYGHPAPMPEIMAVAEAYGSSVIEDAAQAHGALAAGRPVGTWGRAASFSCYPTKNLGALGDAGVVTVMDAQVGELARLVRQYGWRERYISDIPGVNSRLDPIQAAVLRVKLGRLAADNALRRQVAARYDALLPAAVQRPTVRDGFEHVYHQYVIRTDDRDDLAGHLRKEGVPTAVLYPEPVHRHPAYRDRVASDPNGLPVSEEVCRTLLCLPMHPLLAREAVAKVAAHVADWTRKRQ